ncbi:MAG: ferredoxin [Acidimicrobiaceae bacterium]|nr:ferredoxin [Acidimicrobiaceae bacterium]
MRITVDFDRCRSNAVCADLAPEIFEVRGDGYLYLLKENVSGSDITLVEEAVDGCPTQAISISDE